MCTTRIPPPEGDTAFVPQIRPPETPARLDVTPGDGPVERGHPGAKGTMLAAVVALLVAGIAACSETTGRAKPEAPQLRSGALDEILLCEDSLERTPLVFPHRKHYGPRDQGGQAIACGSCHHDYEGPGASLPGSCRTCHFHHDVVVDKAIDSLWIASHQRCGTCHNSPETEYPNAPVYDECDDCHTLPDEVYLDAEGVKLSVSVTVQGPFLDADSIRRHLIERYEEDGAEVTTPGEALSTAAYALRIAEVSDDLVPADSKTLLCQGTCEIVLVHEGDELLRTTLRSKVISGRDREGIFRTIAEYLQKKAYEASAKALDEVLYE